MSLLRPACARRTVPPGARESSVGNQPSSFMEGLLPHAAGQRQAASFIRSAQTYAICGTSTPPTGVVPVRAARPPSRS